MARVKKWKVPLGRLLELKDRRDADQIMICPGRGLFDDYSVILHPSRSALEAFLRRASEKDTKCSALNKTLVGKNMVAYPEYQRAMSGLRSKKRRRAK